MEFIPSFPDVNGIPSAGHQESPSKPNAKSQVGGSLSILGGPFNLKQDRCQWLELTETASSCRITWNVKCSVC